MPDLLNNTHSTKMIENELSDMEQKIHRLINQYRLSLHLPPLLLNDELCEQARRHSEQMAKRGGVLAQFETNKKLKKLEQSASVKAVSQNLAYYRGKPVSADIVVQFWLKSAEHCKNIEGEFRQTGIGIAANSQGDHFFTQLFMV